MITKKKLEKGRKYIYYYTWNFRPQVVEYIGMHIYEPMFENLKGKRFTPRLTDIYRPEIIKKDKKREIIKAYFEAEYK